MGVKDVCLRVAVVWSVIGLGGCGSAEHDHDHDHGEHHAHEDPELAELREAARDAAAEGEDRKPWDPSEAHDHDHAGHDHGDHDGHDHAGHDHGDHAGHDHDGHDHGDHDGHDHGDHDGHDHGEDDGHAHHGGEGHGQDNWLPGRAYWVALEGDPQGLWGERFGPNVTLRAARPFSLKRLRFVGHLGGEAGFERADAFLVEAGDELKVVALASGAIKHGDHTHAAGGLYVYLHRRGAETARVVSRSPLVRGDLEQASVERFLKEQPVTFLAYHDTKPPQIATLERIPLASARQRAAYLRNTPDVHALRELREAGQDTAEAEARVHTVFKATDAEHAEGEPPLTFVVETGGLLDGALTLTLVQKEIGLP